jgi:hypothetical protein
MYLLREAKSTAKPRALNGRSLAHMKLTSRQRAALGAQIAKGEIELKPSASQAARQVGVSTTYVGAACRWSPEKRAAVVRGFPMPKPKAAPKVAPPKVVVMDDAYVADIIRSVGVDRVLNLACQVEQQAA